VEAGRSLQAALCRYSCVHQFSVHEDRRREIRSKARIHKRVMESYSWRHSRPLLRGEVRCTWYPFQRAKQARVETKWASWRRYVFAAPCKRTLRRRIGTVASSPARVRRCVALCASTRLEARTLTHHCATVIAQCGILGSNDGIKSFKFSHTITVGKGHKKAARVQVGTVLADVELNSGKQYVLVVSAATWWQTQVTQNIGCLSTAGYVSEARCLANCSVITAQ